MKPTLLIDSDTLVYSAALAAECPVQWDESLWTLHAEFDQTVGYFEEELGVILGSLEHDRVIMALSASGTRWRESVMPKYKEKRKPLRRPLTYGPLREYIQNKFETFMRPTLEGDDVLGILVTHPKLVPGEKIVVSIDKDMQTLPGRHLNYTKAKVAGPPYEQSVVDILEYDADRFHMWQTLTGDKTDGYPGCPGIGPVKADKILNNVHPAEWWDVVVGAYKKAGLTEADALQNAQVARICRHTDYDFQKKEVVLWTPIASS